MRPMRKKGMTLVELLVVISIILILAVMILPALMKSFKQALVNRAKVEVGELAKAITAYRFNYGRWPVTGSGDMVYEVNQGLAAMLMGSNTVAYPNTRSIKFITIPQSSTNGNGWVDPWQMPLRFAVDGDGNNIISTSDGISVTGKQVVAYSLGPNTNLNVSTSDPNFDDIRSW